MSWNVSSWGESNKSHKAQIDYGALTLNLIKKQEADVLCFQEYFDRNDWYSKFLNIKAFKEMGYPYSFFVKSFLGDDELKIGRNYTVEIPNNRYCKV